jgi:hypothetical protein
MRLGRGLSTRRWEELGYQLGMVGRFFGEIYRELVGIVTFDIFLRVYRVYTYAFILEQM